MVCIHKGKEMETGKTVIGFYYQQHSVDGELEHMIRSLTDPGKWQDYKIELESLCMYTGKDRKDGLKIWENDHVQYHFDENVVGIIRFGEYQNCFDSSSCYHVGFYVDWGNSKRSNMRKDLGYWIDVVGATVISDNEEKTWNERKSRNS